MHRAPSTCLGLPRNHKWSRNQDMTPTRLAGLTDLLSSRVVGFTGRIVEHGTHAGLLDPFRSLVRTQLPVIPNSQHYCNLGPPSCYRHEALSMVTITQRLLFSYALSSNVAKREPHPGIEIIPEMGKVLSRCRNSL